MKSEGNSLGMGDGDLGGGSICRKTGADGYGEDVEKAVKRASRFISAKQGYGIFGGRNQS